MFRSSRKKGRFSFEEELEERLGKIAEDTPDKETQMRNRLMVKILDEAVEELATSKQQSPRNQQIQQMPSLQLQENSSISLHSKLGQSQHEPNRMQAKDHISYLVSHPQVIKVLIDNYPYCSDKERILFSDFIRKIYSYYYGITVRQEELAQLKERLKTELTTTDPEYVSLNALEIVAKRHKLVLYFMSAYISAKVDIKVNEQERRNKRVLNELKEREDRVKESEERLSADEEQYARKYNSFVGKEKAFNTRVKEFNQREKELKKSIEEKMAKLYEGYLSQFTQKIKETQKRLANTEKNLKYKIQILERRSQTLKQLINEKNDLKSKKVMGENEAKIRLRKMQKEMQLMEKKYQSQIEVLEKEEKDMMKSFSLMEEKMAKMEKKMGKYKERIAQLEEELALARQENQKIVIQRNELEHRLERIEQSPLKVKEEENTVKVMKEKTGRSSKNKKKDKAIDYSQIIGLYQCTLQCINAGSRNRHQQLIGKIMKIVVKQLPLLIHLLTCNEDEEGVGKEPHYLVLNITHMLFKEFYLLHSTQESKQGQSKIRSSDIQELLKYPYRNESRFSIFLLFLEVYDWREGSSARFFAKTIQLVIEQQESQGMLRECDTQMDQIRAITSVECAYFMTITFYNTLEHETSDSQGYPNALILCVAVTDILIHLIKAEQDSVFEELLGKGIQEIISRLLVLVLSAILQAYSSGKGKRSDNAALFGCVESLQQLAQKSSILMQRVYYRYSKHLPSPSPKFHQTAALFLDLSLSTANRHSLICANLRSILSCSSPLQCDV